MTAVFLQDDLIKAKQCIAEVFADQTVAEMKIVLVQHDLRKPKEQIPEVFNAQPANDICSVWSDIRTFMFSSDTNYKHKKNQNLKQIKHARTK